MLSNPTLSGRRDPNASRLLEPATDAGKFGATPAFKPLVQIYPQKLLKSQGLLAVSLRGLATRLSKPGES